LEQCLARAKYFWSLFPSPITSVRRRSVIVISNDVYNSAAAQRMAATAFGKVNDATLERIRLMLAILCGP
jgi:hypothetical protein